MQKEAETHLHDYIRAWNLQPDGDAFSTRCSTLQPVLYDGAKAFLKIATEEEEKLGPLLLSWWDGKGAAKVFRYDEQALLMERISSTHPSLIEMVKDGRDDEATRIICGVANELHAPSTKPLPPLLPLTEWFSALFNAGDKYGSLVTQCTSLAARLLPVQEDIAVLHGDLHHENILHSDIRGWVAIDPKRLIGERAFDFANILCNPDKATALKEGRLMNQAAIIAHASGIPLKHLLEWIAAWAGLSAVWILDDGDDASLDLGVAERAFNQLSLMS